VKYKTPSEDFVTCTIVQDKNDMRSARARRFGIARKRKVAQTAWIETIEYKGLAEWRTGGETRGFANKRGLPF